MINTYLLLSLCYTTSDRSILVQYLSVDYLDLNKSQGKTWIVKSGFVEKAVVVPLRTKAKGKLRPAMTALLKAV